MVAFKVKSLLTWRPLPYLVALLVTLTIFGIHMLPSLDSMLNENNTQISHVFLKSQINYHKELTPFARRPLTTFLIESTSKIFNIKYGYGFILVNFFLLYVSGTLIFRLSRVLKATLKEALINMLVYFSSFSLLFAFFPPVFSYDEPLQYCFVLGALIAFVRQQWFLYVILFTLASITRETSLLLLPGLVLFLPTITQKVVGFSTSNRILLYAKILVPLLLYGLYLFLFMNTYGHFDATKIEIESRYSCFLENFESTKNTVESILSLFFALGPFVYLFVFQKIAYKANVLENNWVKAFALSFIINTPLVILTAFARESRLFALPLLLIWPLFAQLFHKEMNLLFSLNAYRQLFRNQKYALIFLVVNVLNFGWCFYYYFKLGLGENTLYAEYLFLINFMMTSHFLKYMAKKELPFRAP